MNEDDQGQFGIHADDQAAALLTRQFLGNIASSFVVSRLIGDRADVDEADPLVRIFDAASKDLIDAMGSLAAPLFYAELYGFKIMRGIDVASNVSLIRNLDQTRGRVLEIDSHLFQMIMNEFSPQRLAGQQ